MSKNQEFPVIQVEGLRTKFDIAVVSNSFIRAIGSYLEARIMQHSTGGSVASME